MIVTVVTMPTVAPAETEPLSLDAARERFSENAASYLDVPGLLWKAYVVADDGRTVGGTYWWADRASAEARFNDGWRAGVTAKYGAEPRIEWFEAPVVVDSRFGMVRVTAPPSTAGDSIGPAATSRASADPDAIGAAPANPASTGTDATESGS